MRIFKGCLMLLAFFFLPLLGTETEKILTIKELVSKIKNAPDDKKRVLINQLKGRLKKMSKENRIEAMRELQKSFKSKKRTKEDEKTTERKRGRDKKHSQPKFRHLHRGFRGFHYGNNHR